jgi:ribonucleoside-diphosphate reductase alpha chain
MCAVPELETIQELFTDQGWHLTDKDRTLIEAWEKGPRLAVVRKQREPVNPPAQFHMPDERFSITHRFRLTDGEETLKGCILVGAYPSGRVGEVIIRMGKPGSMLSGIMSALSYSLSLALQHGIPLSEFITHYRFTQFAPTGVMQGDGVPDSLRMPKSLLDYIFGWLDLRAPEGQLLSSTKH